MQQQREPDCCVVVVRKVSDPEFEIPDQCSNLWEQSANHIILIRKCVPSGDSDKSHQTGGDVSQFDPQSLHIFGATYPLPAVDFVAGSRLCQLIPNK